MMKRLNTLIGRYPLEILFFVSAAASLTSLVLSVVLAYPPCDLCWYQRIFMFPLPFIFGLGLVMKDRKAILYSAPLIAVGATISLYHNFLQWGFISENLLECSYASVSCADPIINWFGFLTIPLGSLLSFVALGVLAAVVHDQQPLKVKTDKVGANRLLWLAGGLMAGVLVAVALINLS